jgi:hypothetical protein
MPEPNDLSAILFFAPDVILLDGFINRKMGQRLCRKIKLVLKLLGIPVLRLWLIIFVEQYVLLLHRRERRLVSKNRPYKNI